MPNFSDIFYSLLVEYFWVVNMPLGSDMANCLLTSLLLLRAVPPNIHIQSANRAPFCLQTNGGHFNR